MDSLPSDSIRQSLLSMSHHGCFSEREKLPLVRVLSLLSNLEAISNDRETSFDEDNIKLMAVSVRCSAPFRSFDGNAHFPQEKISRFNGTTHKSPERAVATVQPYKSYGGSKTSVDSLSPQSSPSKSLSAFSMDESGVFEGDAVAHQATQTCADDFPGAAEEASLSSDLCAEIQKLNRFRRKIEECVTKCSREAADVGLLAPASAVDQQRMQFYADRLELLEKKVQIYESSGDAQARRLAARLQREIQLEAAAKQLQQRVDRLEAVNRQLDEERCELEEIENDTRLQLQRMEVEMEMLSHSNIELEMSRDTARTNVERLQDALSETDGRLLALEAERNALRQQIDLLTAFMPALLLYHAWTLQQSQPRALAVLEAGGRCACEQPHICPEGDRFVELVRREQELTERIAELNRAYNETLERADNLWAQMEKDYKDRLASSQEENQQLQTKIGQLEKRLSSDALYAQERIAQLEEEENVLKRRLAKLNKLSRDEADKYKSLLAEYQALSGEYERLKAHLDGPLAEALDKERRKTRMAQEEMRMAGKMYADIEQLHRSQMGALKQRLERSRKELLAMEVNSNELKGEVLALEHRIIELNQLRKGDEERIQALIAEHRSRDEQPVKPTRAKHNQRNLAQELGPFTRNSANFNYTSVYTLNSVASKISDTIKSFEVSIQAATR